MPSTYTNNLGIQKPGDGEQSGTWGETVNANSDIIDIAINGVLSLSLTGTSSTLTTSDGTVSNGQYKVLVLTGSPSGTHTITISPNDAQKFYLVYNTTAQSVVFTQGSGGNTTIAAGDSSIIYSTGSGASSAVVSIADHLAMSSVKITGGSVSGITDLAIADGGTGASDAATARSNLGAQASSASLTAISGLAVTDNNFIVGNGSTWVAESGATARTSLGLGSIATQASSSVSITGGSITGITDLAVADGGTGASDAATARSNLGAQAASADLTALASASTGILTNTGPGTAAARTMTASTGMTITNGDGVSGNPTFSVTTASTAEIQSLSGTNKLPTTAGIATAAALATPSGAANWTPDWSAFISATWVLTGARTLNNPTNVIAGTTRVVRVASSSSTSQTITWGTNYKGFLTPSVTNTAVALITLYAVSSTEIVVSAVEYSV